MPERIHEDKGETEMKEISIIREEKNRERGPGGWRTKARALIESNEASEGFWGPRSDVVIHLAYPYNDLSSEKKGGS